MRKVTIIVYLIVGLLALTILVLYLTQKRISASKTTPKKPVEKPLVKAYEDSHGLIHVLHFSYDPKTKKSVLLDKKKVRGDQPTLLNKKPIINDDSFGYRVDIISDTGNLIESGWNAEYRLAIEKKDGTFDISVPTRYIRSATLNLYTLDNVLLISTRML